ncbi:MAG TPA: FapA family protein [Spirochaetota bacterium]|nr:FapA family protein [Spirochaetota bacterium]HNT10630.1 FapA family protein [Spirochaetota bacterium]
MKQTIFYFDSTARRLFVEKVDEQGEKHVSLSSPYNFVTDNEIVARVIEIESPEDISKQIDKGQTYYTAENYTKFRAGDGIVFDETARAYRASTYGFAIFDRDRSLVRLLSPLQISKDKVSAFYVIFPTKRGVLPTYKHIEDALFNAKIVAIVDKGEIEQQLAAIDPTKPAVHRVRVARGKSPINGYDEYFIPLIKLEKKAGKVLDDGRIDFREVESIQEIKKGQEILQRFPAVKAVDGYTIYGEKILAEIEKKTGYLKGENIVKAETEENVFVSSIDGCLEVEGQLISVLQIARIKGNVDYDSGNIDFNGSVHIMGSVMPGFSVKAKGNVIIDKNADDATIEAEGDVTVKLGITGKGQSRVIAGGKVRAGYVLNAHIEAVGEIFVDDSIINSWVFSNDKITVTSKHGQIISGEVTARHDVIANVIGNTQENTTTVSVGKSLFIERELLDIRADMEKARTLVNEIIIKIKTSFGEGLFENPKDFIAILPTVKKKQCLLLLKELSDSNKEIKHLAELRAQAEEKLKLDREPSIVANNTIYPGAVLMVKKRKRVINEVMQNVKFFEDPAEKVIRFTSAI